MLTTLALMLLLAPPLTVDTAAAIDAEIQLKKEQINEKYPVDANGQRSSQARAQMLKEISAAERDVLRKHDVTTAQWVRFTSARSPAAARELSDATDKKLKALKEKPTVESKQEVVIQRGDTKDKDPLRTESTDDEGVEINRVKDAEPSAEEQAAQEETPPEPKAKPTPRGRSRGR